MKKFKVGDWVFCEFQLQQIQKMNGDSIRSVCNGYGSWSGASLNDMCFPLSLEALRLSRSFLAWSERLHREGPTSLNFPDIHDWLVSKWIFACNNIKNPEVLDKCMRDLDSWGQEIMNAITDANRVEVQGMRLFRQR